MALLTKRDPERVLRAYLRVFPPRVRLGAADAVATVIGRLARREAFALARFNDGEIGAVVGQFVTVSRGDQRVTPLVAQSLKTALLSAGARMLIGLPCRFCYPRFARYAAAIAPSDALTIPATALQNGLHMASSHSIIGVLRDQPDRTVHWIGSADHDLSGLESRLGRAIVHWKVPATDAFEPALRVASRLAEAGTPDGVILLSCGPASRVAAISMARSNPTITALDIGSLFDPITRGRSHGYHLATAPRICIDCRGPAVRSGRFAFVMDRVAD